MFDVVLFRPEIPPNTGNLMRLCVNTGCRLHLIHPLGFELDDRRLRRAGLDYHEHASVVHHSDFESATAELVGRRMLAFSQFGERLYSDIQYGPGDVLLFGPESVGLPEEILSADAIAETVRIPIAPDGRSLNLANAAAIAIYEAWRQNDFGGVR